MWRNIIFFYIIQPAINATTFPCAVMENIYGKQPYSLKIIAKLIFLDLNHTMLPMVFYRLNTVYSVPIVIPKAYTVYSVSTLFQKVYRVYSVSSVFCSVYRVYSLFIVYFRVYSL